MRTVAARWARPVVTAAGLLATWWAIKHAAAIPDYLLPDPDAVLRAGWAARATLLRGAGVTLAETVLGLRIGTLLGAGFALSMVLSRAVERWLMPVLILSQAVPVFALAPLLVLWLGFGMASKVAMAVLVIFFPIAASLADGLRRTEPGWIDLARTMGATKASVLLRVRLPAAMPSFGNGLRVAAAIAPIGAVVGEWVGASDGLGYVMLNANARIRTDLMFAALGLLAVMTVSLWAIMDRGLRRLLYWAPDTTGPA